MTPTPLCISNTGEERIDLRATFDYNGPSWAAVLSFYPRYRSIAIGHAYADRGLLVVVVDQGLAIAVGELHVEL